MSAQQSPNQVEEEKPEEETELSATPSAGVRGTISVPVVEIEEAEETADPAGMSAEPAMYRPQWANILEDSLLNDPLLRAEWVDPALPPAELNTYAQVDTFDIYDIANRAAILVSSVKLNCYILVLFYECKK